MDLLCLYNRIVILFLTNVDSFQEERTNMMKPSEENALIPGLALARAYLNLTNVTPSQALFCTKWTETASHTIPDAVTLETIRDYAKDAVILDIYSHNGYWASILEKIGARVIASDMTVSERCFKEVKKIRSDALVGGRFEDAILMYGYPAFVDEKNDSDGVGYFPELKVWKGDKIIALVDKTECPYHRLTRRVSWPLTGDVFSAAESLTGSKWKVVLSRPLKYKFYSKEDPRLEIYERIRDK